MVPYPHEWVIEWGGEYGFDTLAELIPVPETDVTESGHPSGEWGDGNRTFYEVNFIGKVS